MNDTPPEIAEMVRARLMAKSGAERFRMGVEMFEAARRMALASLPAGLSETEHWKLTQSTPEFVEKSAEVCAKV